MFKTIRKMFEENSFHQNTHFGYFEQKKIRWQVISCGAFGIRGIIT